MTTFEPARVFLFVNNEHFASIASTTHKIQTNAVSGSILVNKIEFEKVTVSIFRATYGNEYCKSYYSDADLEPELFRCFNNETNEVMLTIYKPTRNHIEDNELLEYQLGNTAAKLFKFSEIDSIVDKTLEFVFGKIKSKTLPSKKLLDEISLTLPTK